MANKRYQKSEKHPNNNCIQTPWTVDVIYMKKIIFKKLRYMEGREGVIQ